MAEQRNIRIEDDAGNQYFPHTKAKTTFIEDTDNLFTATNVEDVLKELFTSADNGKKGIASVIGFPATNNDAFDLLKKHIQDAKNKGAANLTAKGTNASGTESLDSIVSKIANVNTGKKWANGTAVSSGGTQAFRTPKGGYNQLYYVEVSGLDFNPSVVVLNHNNLSSSNNNFSVLFPNNIVKDQTYGGRVLSGKFSKDSGTGSNSPYVNSFSLPVHNEKGFLLPVGNDISGKTFEWTAYE